MKNYNKYSSALLFVAFVALLQTACVPKTVQRPTLPAPPGVSGSFVHNDADWPDVYADASRADYEITTNVVVEDNVMVRIAPGVVIKFTGENAGITVKGALRAIGTPTQPIVLMGTATGRGTWLGVRFRSNSLDNELAYCTVKNAGSDAIDDSGVSITGFAGVYPSRAKITHTTITQSGGYGLYIDAPSSFGAFAENSLNDNGKAPIKICTPQLGSLDALTNYSGNVLSYVEIAGNGAVDMNLTMPKLSVPYQLASGYITIMNGSLFIAPGVEMRFKPNTEIVVDQAGTGALVAEGTAAQPIVFKGATAGRGTWLGIWIAGNSTANHLKYCTVDGGGQAALGVLSSGRANVVVGNVSSAYPYAVIDHCTLSNSGGWGIFKGGNPSINVNSGIINSDAATINTFNNNASGAIGQ
jgi:hypothetical protein